MAGNDVIQREILDLVFDLALELIQEVRGKDTSKRDFNGCFPISTKVMSLDQLDSSIKNLKECNLDNKLWMPTDYHFLLMYELLDCYLDSIEELLDPVEGYKIVKVNDSILDNWFWDQDFLFEAELVTPEIKKLMNINEEVFGIANRLKAHPDELKLTIWPHKHTRDHCDSVEEMIKEVIEEHEEDEVGAEDPLGPRKDGTIRLYDYVIKKDESVWKKKKSSQKNP